MVLAFISVTNMGAALSAMPFCSRGAVRDANNNQPDRPDANLAPAVAASSRPLSVTNESAMAGEMVVDTQPEATSTPTPKIVLTEDGAPDLPPVDVMPIQKRSSSPASTAANPHQMDPAFQIDPPEFDSYEGDSGLEHSHTSHTSDLNIDDESEEDNDDDGVDIDLNESLDTSIPDHAATEEDEEDTEVKSPISSGADEKKESADIVKPSIELGKLEDELIEAEVDNDEDEDAIDKKAKDNHTKDEDDEDIEDLDLSDGLATKGKKGTSDMITDMLNQMMVDQPMVDKPAIR